MRRRGRAGSVLAVAAGLLLALAGNAAAQTPLQSFNRNDATSCRLTGTLDGASADTCGVARLLGSAALQGGPGSPFLAMLRERTDVPGAAPVSPALAGFADFDQLVGGARGGIGAELPPDSPMAGRPLAWSFDVPAAPGGAAAAAFSGTELSLGDTARLGFASGFSRWGLDADGDVFGAAEAWNAATYAIGASGNWRARGVASYASYDLSGLAALPFDTSAAPTAARADQIEALAELSYAAPLGGNAFLSPYLGAGLNWVRSEALSAFGAGSADLFGASEESWPYALVGLRLTTAVPFGDVMVNPTLDLGWRHVFGAVDPEGIDGTATALAAFGAPVAADSLLVQAGFDAALTGGWRTSFKYRGDLAMEAQQHALTGGVAVPF